MKRRMFVANVLVVAAMLLAACATPTPEVIEKVVTQVVKETVKETVIVEGTPQVVEKEVEVTKIVEVTPVVKPEGVLRIGGADLAHSYYELNPLAAPSNATQGLLTNVVNSLVMLNPADVSQISPDLATDWEMSPDGMTWTFNLRRGVVWSDGEPLTADDVVFSLTEIAKETGRGWATASFQEHIETVRAVDDYTVEVTMKKPFCSFLYELANAGWIVPQHVHEADPYAERLSKFPVGSGPYVVTENEVDHITLEYNPEYWGTPPQIAKMIWIDSPDYAARLAMLEAGEIDVMLVNAKDAKELALKGFRIYLSPRNVMDGPRFGFRSPIPFMKDVRTRMALMYAYPTENIAEVVSDRVGLIAPLPLTPLSPSYGDWVNPDVEPFPYDLEKAKQLLDEVGWRDEDGDGILESHDVEGVPDDTKFEFEMAGTAGDRSELYCLVAQEAWRELGIIVEVIAPVGTAWVEFLNTDFVMGAPSAGGSMEPIAKLTAELDCTDLTFSEGTMNFGGYCNQKVDEYLDEANATCDPAKRKELAWKIQEELVKDPAAYWFGQLQSIMASNPRVDMSQAAPGFMNSMTWSRYWYLAKWSE